MAIGALLAERCDSASYNSFTRSSTDRSGSAMFQRILTAGQEIEEQNPYFMLADKDGIINYRGTTFVCDKRTNSLMLGDCSDMNNCIRVSLSGGGSLVVNRDNLGELYNAISMFSPEDIKRILEAIETDKIAQEAGLAAEDAVGELYKDDNYNEQIQEKINEIYQKLITGDTEEQFQTGAQLFSIKEWDQFLERFDKTEEEVQKAQEEEFEKRAEEARREAMRPERANESGAQATDEELELLTAESTRCTVLSGNADEPDISYITWYTQDGIYCRKAGQTEGYAWSILFERREQYEDVMKLLGSVPAESDWQFAAREDFWKEFLEQ